MTNKTNNETFTETTFNGFKNINAIKCNSEWLLNYLHFLEWDAEVKNYFQSDMRLLIEYNQIETKVKIDMWVNLCNGDTYLIHFKNNRIETSPTDHMAVQADCEEFCLKSNLNFQTIDQTIPEHEPRKANINSLWNHAHRKMHFKHLRLINRWFADEPFCNIKEFKNALIDSGCNPDLVYTFLFHHAIKAEVVYSPLSDSTSLTKGKVSDSLFEQLKSANNFEEVTTKNSNLEVFQNTSSESLTD